MEMAEFPNILEEANNRLYKELNPASQVAMFSLKVCGWIIVPTGL
jgi:hypothetical protein